MPVLPMTGFRREQSKSRNISAQSLRMWLQNPSRMIPGHVLQITENVFPYSRYISAPASTSFLPSLTKHISTFCDIQRLVGKSLLLITCKQVCTQLKISPICKGIQMDSRGEGKKEWWGTEAFGASFCCLTGWIRTHVWVTERSWTFHIDVWSHPETHARVLWQKQSLLYCQTESMQESPSSFPAVSPCLQRLHATEEDSFSQTSFTDIAERQTVVQAWDDTGIFYYSLLKMQNSFDWNDNCVFHLVLTDNFHFYLVLTELRTFYI